LTSEQTKASTTACRHAAERVVTLRGVTSNLLSRFRVGEEAGRIIPRSAGLMAIFQQPMEVIVATRNKGKLREFRDALKGLNLRIYGLSDFPDAPEIEEDGRSFTENALKKVRFYSRYFGKLTLADDSGLEVDSLKGQPGVHSARYAGERASSQENNQKLLEEMQGVPISKRGARFRCIIAVKSPGGREVLAEGACKGRIGFKEKGRKGFGYDPLFILPRDGRTMAQLSLEEKNKISHRGKALRKIRRIIKTFGPLQNLWLDFHH
jgi:XTP/dITP diphosphohydrolase